MVFFINSPFASANENLTNGDLKQKYTEGIKVGAIDKSITYEQWEKIVAENEKALEKIKKDTVKEVHTSTTIIGPYGLLDSFADNYRPSLVKTFYLNFFKEVTTS
ncbi:hypothetical protein [Bacillus paranthracis]|uniref:hypothetical protein n=1 Tax=Bacillus paranthracis TaxID=2026186 RepID=UPI0039A2D727